MADETTAAEATEQPKRSPVVMAAVAMLALAAGGGVGAFVVGPMLGPASAAEAPATGGGEGHGGEGEAAEGLVFSLDGVIVNPAGSRGQHHLIATVAWEVETPADEAALRGAEIALRDAVGSLLERKTLDELTAPGIRDTLRGELKRLAEPHLSGGVVEVYLPQFIVQ